jgi:microcompartment protein CcmK/EutM
LKRSIAFGILGAALVLGACGNGESESATSSSSENTFVLSEFTIIAPTNELRTGNVQLTADNVGAEVHELVIVRAASADALPKKRDGSVDESKLRGPDEVGVIDTVAAHSRQSARFDLKAGRYVAFCNLIDNTGSSTSVNGSGRMSTSGGPVHFARGMHVTFTVR